MLTSPNLKVLGVRIDCSLTLETLCVLYCATCLGDRLQSHVRDAISVVLCHVSRGIDILMVNGVISDTTVLLRCYSAFIFRDYVYCYNVWETGLWCMPAVSFTFLTVWWMRLLGFVQIRVLCLWITVAELCKLYKVLKNSKPCQLPIACRKLRLNLAAVAAHPYEYEVPKCRTSQATRCSLPIGMYNDITCVAFDVGMLNWF